MGINAEMFDADSLAESALAIQYVMARLEMFPADERPVLLRAAKTFLDYFDQRDAVAA